MQQIFKVLTDSIHWFFDTGWGIWCHLFAPLPYGDPYIAIIAAMMVFYMAVKIINPSNQHY